MRLSKMTWPKVQAYFSKNDTVLLAVGSTECHGRHLPVGTDTLIPDSLLNIIEVKRPDVMIAPTVPYGVCDYFEEFPGTVDLGDELLYQVLGRITTSLYNHGARHFIVLNGHGGNIRAISRVAHDLFRKGGLLALLNWWKMVWDMNPEWKGGHGGGEETAAILGIDPALVDQEEIHHPLTFKHLTEELKSTHFSAVEYKGVSVEIPRLTWDVNENGWVGPDHPETATEAWGKEMLATCANYIADFIGAFQKAPLDRYIF